MYSHAELRRCVCCSPSISALSSLLWTSASGLLPPPSNLMPPTCCFLQPASSLRLPASWVLPSGSSACLVRVAFCRSSSGVKADHGVPYAPPKYPTLAHFLLLAMRSCVCLTARSSLRAVIVMMWLRNAHDNKKNMVCDRFLYFSALQLTYIPTWYAN